MLLTVATLACTAMLMASAIGKLTGEPVIGRTMAQWGSLGVPRVLVNRHLVRAHPYVELVLAVLLLVPGTIGLIAAIITAALLVCYTYFLYQGIRSGIATTCSCFGDDHDVTWYSVLRNAGFFALALMAIADHWGAVGGPVGLWRSEGALQLALAVVLVGCAVSVVIGMSHRPAPKPTRPNSQPAAAQPVPSATGEADELDQQEDYQRMPLLFMPLKTASGEVRYLPEISGLRPVLLINASTTCAYCADAIARLEQWEEALGGIVDIALLTTDDVETFLQRYPDTADRLYHDYLPVVATAYMLSTPTAILLGIDSYLAGGPASGVEEISQLVADMRAELQAAGVLAPDADDVPAESVDSDAQTPH